MGRADLPRTTRDDAPTRWLLRATRPLGRAVLHRWYDLSLRGVENIPAEGPVIISGNHIGYLDGPLVAIVGPRPGHVLTKRELFHGFLGRFLDLTGQIQVRRGEADLPSVRTALRVLHDGGVLGIFPEGSRCDGELLSCHPGVGYFALVTGASIVPMSVLGTRLPGARSGSLPPRGSRIVLTFGEPLRFEAQPWPRRAHEVREATSRIRNAMLATSRSATEATGMQLPGPLPEGDTP